MVSAISVNVKNGKFYFSKLSVFQASFYALFPLDLVEVNKYLLYKK